MTDYRQGRYNIMPPLTPVVKNIIIINVIMVVIQFILGQFNINLQDYLGLHYWGSPLFHWWQVITHIFMHGNPYSVQETIFHIGFNMFALWMFGGVLENIWGPKRFLIFYMICGVGAAFCHLTVLGFEFNSLNNAFMAYQQNPSYGEFARFVTKHDLLRIPDFNFLLNRWSGNINCAECSGQSVSLINAYHSAVINEATVGASGAIMGVLFAFGYLFPNTLLYFYFLVPIKAKWVVAGCAIFELYEGVQNSAGDNIAHFAHLGGMLFAFILLRIWNKRIRNNFY